MELVRGMHSLACLTNEGNYQMRLILVVEAVVRSTLQFTHRPPPEGKRSQERVLYKAMFGPRPFRRKHKVSEKHRSAVRSCALRMQC